MKDGESVYVRYVTSFQDLIYVAQHSSCPTKTAPLGEDGKPQQNWPSIMSAVCRKDEAFAKMYADCFICDAKIKNQYGNIVGNPVRIWALAVLREEVLGDGTPERGGPEMLGRRVGCVDKMVEVQATDKDGKPIEGKTEWQKHYVLVNFAQKNYYAGLSAMYAEYKTINDRDYRVSRTGASTDSTYQHIPLDPTPALKPGTEKWQTKYLDDLAAREIDLAAIVADKASDEYYERFFDTRTSGQPASSAPAGAVTADTVEQQPDADEVARVAALRDRVQGARASDID
jgi:hypothetical protein